MDEEKFVERANFAKVNLENVKFPSAAVRFTPDVEEAKYR